jgi:putative oxidoreductase
MPRTPPKSGNTHDPSGGRSATSVNQSNNRDEPEEGMDFRHLERFQPQLRAILRIVVALLFMEHGLAKLIHFPVPQPGVPSPLPPILVAAEWIEVIGGALIAVGLYTRLVAFICAGEMAIGYFMFHFPKSFWPIVNMGEGAILFCFVFLYLAAAGPGAWSIDSMRNRNAPIR